MSHTVTSIAHGAAPATAPAVSSCEVLVIGAGPYGLAAGAALRARGIDAKVFGKLMDFWANKMPAGMLLRSPRPASSIADPTGTRTLESYEAAHGLPAQAPLPLTTFVAYGRWFQRELLPDLDPREIASVEATGEGFRSLLTDGTHVASKRVVVAAGIGPFQRIPDALKTLPGALLTHCYSGFDVHAFKGKKIVVIGAGQSALESAALLHEAGAEVEILARLDQLRWIGMHPRLHQLGPISAMLYSKHDIGPIGISRLVAYPNLVRRIPLALRDIVRKRAVRAAGSNWLPARLAKVPVRTSTFVTSAAPVGEKARLRLNDGTELVADHVLLGTGYSVDISRFGFLSPKLLQRVQVFDGYPVLRPGFETSLPGLHFIGASAARTFGPLLNFVTGTEFTSGELLHGIAGR